jgi:hypothetical protein
MIKYNIDSGLVSFYLMPGVVIIRGNMMKRLISVALLTALLAGCAHDSPCVPTYDDQGRLVHTNTCMKGTTQDNWETAGAIAGGAAALAGLTLGIVALTK